MPASQYVHLVTTGPGGTQGLDAVNDRLKKGWRVAHIAPMGAAGGGTTGGEGVAFASLIVLERSGHETEGVLEQIEEEIERVEATGEIEEVLEGDGSSRDVPPEPRPPGTG